MRRHSIEAVTFIASGSLTDYFSLDMLDVRYKSVNFGADMLHLTTCHNTASWYRGTSLIRNSPPLEGRHRALDIFLL